MSCVATVRGALGKLDGVGTVTIERGRREFTVDYDPAAVDVPAMLAALDAAGEGARRSD